MGSCTRRHFLLSTCFLQMITIIERQVFDFLGYMWAPILVNFFHILFIIFGFYGAYHFRIKYIITYLIWNFLWIGWNSFLICFYLNVGTLDRDSDLLNLGTGSVSWFEVNGYGCKPIYNTNITSEDPYRPLRPESVEDCLLTYDIVEVVHSGVQCILAFFGILGAILISYIFLDEDDRFDFMNGDAKSPQHTVVHPMYVSYTSIPTSASGTMLSNKHQNHTLNHHQHHLHNHPNHQQNTLSNSNNHLNNSTHAISTTTTTPITTTTSTTNNHNINNNSCNTPLATKKKFSSSSLANSIQQQQQTSLHKHILTANATTAINNYSNNINNSNSISHSHSNSNRNSSNSNQQQHNNNIISNSNTFLIHSHNSNSRSRGATADISSYNGSLLSNASQYQAYNSGGSRRNRQHRNMSPSLSTASNSLTHMLYSPKQGRKVQPSSSNSIFPANIDLAQKQPIIPAYYDDSTAKADHQLYVNGSRRQILIAQSPNQDTTPSLSYASLQNSTQNLNSSFKQNATPSNALSSSLSNSNYSLTNSLNNNQMAAVSGASGSGTSGHFARIHSKPKPAKSSSYSSFKHSACASNQPPDLKYNQIFNENSARSNTSPDQQQQPEFEECFEEDDFSVQNLKTDEGVTYIPFTKPTPGNYFLTPPPPPSTQSGNNNKPNPTISSLSSQNSLNNNSHQQQQQQFPPASISPNNNTSVPHMYHDNSAILLEHGAILQPLTAHELSPAQRALMYQQNGLPFHPAYSPVPYRQNSACTAQKPTPRPTNIPLPKVPDTYQAEFLSPSEVTPPPPPLPRPHIFQPRTGTAPYPDLSPEVTERYAMPTQYIPRSPVATRIARRQRQQNASNERSHGPSANYCDQIRDTTNGYGPDSTAANTYTITKARSYDRLTSSQSVNGSFKDNKRNAKTKTEELTSPPPNSPLSKDMAPHVNRRSGRRDGQKARPRSYCNSMSGGEGVIRGNIALDRKVGYAN